MNLRNNKSLGGIKMKLVYVHDENNIEVLAEILTNHSISVEDAIYLANIDLNEVLGDEYDYNALDLRV